MRVIPSARVRPVQAVASPFPPWPTDSGEEEPSEALTGCFWQLPPTGDKRIAKRINCLSTDAPRPQSHGGPARTDAAGRALTGPAEHAQKMAASKICARRGGSDAIMSLNEQPHQT